ncbi:YHS domain-containing (seleno)protein [Pseudovibrio sp. SPO723]|uniref:YHS domain-containing (seleno)protein n=1 Tax=Nesiotobacter zosterae TaxID=392721 RepID=UPI0029C2F7B4|nr:YHS domain-containing (seleno)protein [Pseudovibrio sp. SPO723]MDX5594452.1 YHS domain-containing (seleno)protein [Pseudovibrio sp. SPO723]
MPIKSTFKAIALAGLMMTAAPAMTFADEVTTFTADGLAIKGTDPVAYFTQGKPVPGKKEFSTTYDDVTWQFSSAENLQKFEANPEKYAPQYGGWCATGVSFGYKIPIMPEKWAIVDGKLYLNAHDGAHRRFTERTDEVINNANTNWPTIKETPADELG